MDKILKFLDTIKAFMSYVIYKNEETSVHITIRTVVLLIVVLLITHFVLRSIRIITTKKLRQESQYRFKAVFSFLKYIIFSIVIVVALDSSGVKITAILAASTALFVGIGLGMQKLFQDIISGVFILIDRTVAINDIVEIDNKVAKITEISLRTTKAITIEDKTLIIPNHKFLIDILYNWTQNSVVIREFVSVGVAYGTNVDNVKALLLEVAESEKSILKNPKPMVFFEDFGDSALNFNLHFYIKDSFNVPLIKSNLRYKIYEVFNTNNIKIPFPQRDIHIKTEPS